MLYHITYRTRDGRTEVGRVGADNRNQAISTAAARFNVSRAAIQSAVGCPKRAATPPAPSVLAEALWHDAQDKWAAERAWRETPADEPF